MRNGNHSKTYGEQWHEEAVKHSKRDAIAVYICIALVLLLSTAFAAVRSGLI